MTYNFSQLHEVQDLFQKYFNTGYKQFYDKMSPFLGCLCLDILAFDAWLLKQHNYEREGLCLRDAVIKYYGEKAMQLIDDLTSFETEQKTAPAKPSKKKKAAKKNQSKKTKDGKVKPEDFVSELQNAEQRETCDGAILEVTTENGFYSFPNDEQSYKDIISHMKSLDRRLANICNYGDERGRSAVFKDNPTCLALVKMKASPLLYQEAPYIRLMQQFASHAPIEAAPFLFLNLYDRIADAGVSLTIKCSYDIATIMPPAWYAGYEQLHHLDGLLLAVELQYLVPRYRKGDIITYRHRHTKEEYKAEVLKVIFKQYYQKPYKDKFGYVEYIGSGPWVAWYHTAYGDYRYDEVK